MKINKSKVTSRIAEILEQNGLNKRDAKTIVDVLIFAEESGVSSQGIVKLVGPRGLQHNKAKHQPKIVKESPATAMIDGGNSLAMIAVDKAVGLAIEKAQACGVSVVGTNNTTTSSGTLSYFIKKITNAGLVGIITTRSPNVVATQDSIDPLLGTNPIAIGVPTSTDPVILDMSTAAITYFGVVKASHSGDQLPEGVAIDSEGVPTTDPDAALKGALLPFSESFKSSGLGIMIELMSGPLMGSGASTREGDMGHMIIAINPESLGGKEALISNTEAALERIRSARGRSDLGVAVPGQRSAKRRRNFAKSDSIDIPESIAKELGLNL